MNSIHRRLILKGMGASALAMSTHLPAWAQTAEKPVSGGTLKVGLTANNTKTLNPIFSTNPDERPLLYCLYNTLAAIQPDFSLEPELAESWEIEDDGKRYVFHLKKGVTFHDGTPFDAEAVKYNILQRITESVKSTQFRQLNPVIKSLEVLSSHDIAFNLNYAYPALLADMADRAGCMVSPTASEKFGADFGRNPVGTGPFKLGEWIQGTSIILEKNPDYWVEGLPYLDTIELVSVPNVATGIQRMSIGEIDHMDRVTPTDARLVQAVQSVHSVRMPDARWYALGWQVDTEPFKNAKLRAAIAHAIDRDRLNQIILGGEGTVANGFTPPGYWFSNEPKVKLEYSVEKAKALLDESGYPKDKPLTLVVPSYETYSRISQLVAEMLQNDLGLKITMQPVPQSEYWSKVVRREANWGPTSWTVRPDPDTQYHYLLHKDGAANTSGYDNPEVNKMLEEARATTDKAKRKELYGKVEEYLMTEFPFIMLYFTADYVVLRDVVKNYVPMADQVPRWRYVWKEQV